jgi:hypothetical protein
MQESDDKEMIDLGDLDNTYNTKWMGTCSACSWACRLLTTLISGLAAAVADTETINLRL